MTHHEIKILEDGTRVYSNHTRYKPKTDEERKYERRKPDVEGAVSYNKEWFLPLALLDPAARVMPETRPDTDAYEHAAKPRKCSCRPCQRESAAYWRAKWRRDHVTP